MNTCDFYQELISRMLDDELTNNERSVLAEHLYMCDECAAMYSAFSMVSDMVATDLAEPPEELAEDVMAHIRRAEIRKRNRRNTRATKNAIVAAACVAFMVAAVGGVAVVRSHRSDNVVYESRMSQSTAASSAKDGSYDTVIVSEAPVVQESNEQYVAPVEKYIAAPQQQEEKNFFASILPDSWFTASTPAPTQPPVVYATPVATPFMQTVTAPNFNSAPESGMPAVVVVSPPVTENQLMVITPAPTEAPVVELPAVTESPVVEELPVITEAPVVEALPVTTEAPVVETLPVVTEAPAMEAAPVITEAPVSEQPVIIDAPMTEGALPEAQPPMEAPAELPAVDMSIFTDVPMVEYAAPSDAAEEALPMEQDSFAVEQPVENAVGPVVANHDFSAIDCTEFVNAIFTAKKTEDAAAAQEAASESETAQANFASVIDKLIALKAVELCSLPENAEAQRMETLSFSVEGQIFTVQLSFIGEEIYVQCSAGDGSPISFRTAMSTAEYDSFVALCYTFDGNV